MKSQALQRHGVLLAQRRRHTIARVVRFATDRFLLLLLGAALALLWANVESESYFTFAHAVAFPVNEIGMALFLGLIAQDVVEAIMPGGALGTWRRWSMPIVAAMGGLVGTTLTYVGFVTWKHEQVLLQAWPIASAIDIAAGYYLLKLIFRRRGALTFFLVLAIATDVLAMVVLVVWPPFAQHHIVGGLLVAAAVGVAAIMRGAMVQVFWPYLAGCGMLSWYGLYTAGIHPALALIPIVPFLPHEPRPLDLFADRTGDDPIRHAEHDWNVAVQITLFLFGLVNAGVIFRRYDTGSWAVLSAALIGRPLGVLAAVGVAVAAGLHVPRSLGWRDLTVIALATSSGFTFALFLATSVLPVGAVLEQIKVGALATIVGALLTYGLARILHVGRFAAKRTSKDVDRGYDA